MQQEYKEGFYFETNFLGKEIPSILEKKEALMDVEKSAILLE